MQTKHAKGMHAGSQFFMKIGKFKHLAWKTFKNLSAFFKIFAKNACNMEKFLETLHYFGIQFDNFGTQKSFLSSKLRLES